METYITFWGFFAPNLSDLPFRSLVYFRDYVSSLKVIAQWCKKSFFLLGGGNFRYYSGLWSFKDTNYINAYKYVALKFHKEGKESNVFKVSLGR